MKHFWRGKVKIKKEKISIKPDIKTYKRQARAMVGFPPPTMIHKNKKKYNRKRDKLQWKKEWKESL